MARASTAALRGDADAFRESLDRPADNLRTVGEVLKKITGGQAFDKLTAEGFGEIRTANDILRAIATLASQSAKAIDPIQTGNGSKHDFAVVATNSSRISELVLVFYNLLIV